MEVAAGIDSTRKSPRLEAPAQLRAEVAREFTRLALVLEQIAGLEAARDAVVKRAVAPADRATAKIGKLFTLKSMGPEFATTFVREVYYRDFANRRQVGSYFGLAGSPWLSGRLAVEQGISKAGNPRARTLMIEAAWTWLRCGITLSTTSCRRAPCSRAEPSEARRRKASRLSRGGWRASSPMAGNTCRSLR